MSEKSSAAPGEPAARPGPRPVRSRPRRSAVPAIRPARPIPVPDLLHLEPRLALDGAALVELLETSFIGGGGVGPHLEEALGRPQVQDSTWQPEFFADELFLADLLEDCFTVRVRGAELPVNDLFLRHVLSRAPVDLGTITFRQEIVRELDADADLNARAHELYGELFTLLSFFKASHKRAKLDITMFRLEILEQARKTVDFMAEHFSAAGSGLGRLHAAATEIRATEEWRLLTALLDYENHLARLSFDVRIGADGRIRHLELVGLTENVRNPFYRAPWQRLKDRIQLLRHGYEFTNREIINRVVHEVFLRISEWLKPLLQLLGHLAFYLAAFSLRERARGLGLEMTLATFSDAEPLRLEGLFNPLLFRQGAPVPCSIEAGARDSIFIVTGPNSGGKTRLLQAVGLAQLLGQSGIFVPAARARLPVVDGLFASTTERASVDQLEGRLGTELMRIRELFESIGSRSLVLMDELCSGTNPSEAVEIFLMVLELLEKLDPVALITTHFLDFARRLEAEPPIAALEFLQVEMREGQRSSYQFLPGVAPTSLASSTARRLGVTLEELSRLIRGRERAAR